MFRVNPFITTFAPNESHLPDVQTSWADEANETSKTAGKTPSQRKPKKSARTMDVDMDAPQISTLRETTSPPPAAPSSKGPRVKLVLKKRNTSPPTKANATGQTDDDEVEEEEDQLIYDEDSTAQSSVPAKRKASVGKKKPRKKVAEEPPKDVDSSAGANAEEGPLMIHIESASTMKAPAKKKTGRKAGSTVSSSVSAPAPAKPKVIQKPKVNPLPLAEDQVTMSEYGTGTPPSSPGTMQPSPEPESTHPSVPEEVDLEGVPIPVYPLPAKPFPVMPPVKIASGFAPANPIDKTRGQVRHWRVAHREIRGISGGRFLVRSWVGEKDSQFATNKAAAESEKSTTSQSVSAPPGGAVRGRPRGGKSQSMVSSRAGSILPESAQEPQASRQLTKMRTIVQPEPEAEVDDEPLLHPEAKPYP